MESLANSVDDPSESVDHQTESESEAPTELLEQSRPRLQLSEVPSAYVSGHPESAISSWSVNSDKQLGYASPGPIDRVFPMRSVVSVDTTQTPFMGPIRTSGEHDGFPGFDVANHPETPGQGRSTRWSMSQSSDNENGPKRPRLPSISNNTGTSGLPQRSKKDPVSAKPSTNNDEKAAQFQLFSDAASTRSDQTGSTLPGSTNKSTKSTVSFAESVDKNNMGNLVTARFKHIVTDGGHAVITGRGGETLQRCEDEPIHIPGAVQAFGLLIALQEESDGQLVVRIVSENSKRMIGFTPQELFKLSSFTDILSEEQADTLLDHVDFIKDEEADPATNGPEVFTISIKAPRQRRNTKLWCAMHINPVSPDIIICEFELDDDQLYPLFPADAETPEPPEDTLHSNPTEEEYNESTTNSSKPLRVLRNARKRKGEAAAMEVFNIMSQIQEQLANAANLEQFLKILIGVVKELTGFHRVMIYQFDANFNGRVVTELVDPRATKDLYKGLNFPASDIPKQARELYKVNKVRLLYDRDLETARLVCRTIEDLESPLDLSFSYLRAMSPIHIKYLANMAVRSSMSISINAFNELWGLIALHSYGSKGMRVSFPIRKMCRLVGDTASRNIERLSYASRLQARKLINTVPTEANPSGYIIASSDDLLKLFDADFGLLSIKGETKIMGNLEQSQEALAMLEYLKLRKITSVTTSSDIKQDFPDLRYQPGFQVIAGLLLVPLSVGGVDFIVFFRKGQTKVVKWAGNPYEKFIREGTEGYLEPRKSFQTWSETVVGKCREWTEEQVETAAVLCLVYGKFIEVWRQKEAALQSSQLTKLLLANSAHEVRTPLNAIINYLEIALEGALDQETRENLAKSHSASKSLIYVINDLLDLTKTEEGRELIKDEIFDLVATVRDAAEAFQGDARRKGIQYEFIEQPGIPQLVHGDHRRVRQAVSNLVANAIQHTSGGWVRVELWLAEDQGSKVAVDIVISDSGSGMSDQQLDALFRDLEQVSTDGDSVLHPEDDESPVKKEREKRTLGLGLAFVARVVRNMEGQLRLKSEAGKGSRFVIQLPFDLPESTEASDTSMSTVTGTQSPSPHVQPSHVAPPAAEGEVTLVDKANPTRSGAVLRKRSTDDVASISSTKSGSFTSVHSDVSSKSDMDRLLDAFSEPLNVGVAEPENIQRARSNSRGSGNSRKSAGSLRNAPVGNRPPGSAQLDRPKMIARAKSHSTAVDPEHLRQSQEAFAGAEFIKDNRTLLKAVRMPDEYQEEVQSSDQPHTASRVLFSIPDKQDKKPASFQSTEPRKQTVDHLQVLVAEDDPVNSRIIIKRMEKQGHEVLHTVNGEDCASAYGDKPALYDVVLMDMQMPIVDGLTSTKMIRSYEKSHTHSKLSPRAKDNGRVPIFAVSASLVERERQSYIDAGFDGWILKPIDFKRLNELLAGIVDEDTRNLCLYRPGGWERGGWFQKRQPKVTEANTKPTGGTPVANPPQKGPEPLQPDSDTVKGAAATPNATTSITDERMDVKGEEPTIECPATANVS